LIYVKEDWLKQLGLPILGSWHSGHRRQHLRHRCGQFFGLRQVLKLVGSMQVALGPKQPTHHHLRPGKSCGQQVRERNGAALTNVAADQALYRAKRAGRNRVEVA